MRRLIASTLLPLALVLGCGDEETDPPERRDCGFDRDTRFVFSDVELVPGASTQGCPEVTAADANGAEQPDCNRRLDECELVVSCEFAPAEGLTLVGTGRLAPADGGAELSGRIEVRLGSAECHYDVRVELQ